MTGDDAAAHALAWFAIGVLSILSYGSSAAAFIVSHSTSLSAEIPDGVLSAFAAAAFTAATLGIAALIRTLFTQSAKIAKLEQRLEDDPKEKTL